MEELLRGLSLAQDHTAGRAAKKGSLANIRKKVSRGTGGGQKLSQEALDKRKRQRAVLENGSKALKDTRTMEERIKEGREKAQLAQRQVDVRRSEVGKARVVSNEQAAAFVRRNKQLQARDKQNAKEHAEVVKLAREVLQYRRKLKPKGKHDPVKEVAKKAGLNVRDLVIAPKEEQYVGVKLSAPLPQSKSREDENGPWCEIVAQLIFWHFEFDIEKGDVSVVDKPFGNKQIRVAEVEEFVRKMLRGYQFHRLGPFKTKTNFDALVKKSVFFFFENATKIVKNYGEVTMDNAVALRTRWLKCLYALLEVDRNIAEDANWSETVLRHLKETTKTVKEKVKKVTTAEKLAELLAREVEDVEFESIKEELSRLGERNKEFARRIENGKRLYDDLIKESKILSDLDETGLRDYETYVAQLEQQEKKLERQATVLNIFTEDSRASDEELARDKERLRVAMEKAKAVAEMQKGIEKTVGEKVCVSINKRIIHKIRSLKILDDVPKATSREVDECARALQKINSMANAIQKDKGRAGKAAFDKARAVVYGADAKVQLEAKTLAAQRSEYNKRAFSVADFHKIVKDVVEKNEEAKTLASMDERGDFERLKVAICILSWNIIQQLGLGTAVNFESGKVHISEVQFATNLQQYMNMFGAEGRMEQEIIMVAREIVGTLLSEGAAELHIEQHGKKFLLMEFVPLKVEAFEIQRKQNLPNALKFHFRDIQKDILNLVHLLGWLLDSAHPQRHTRFQRLNWKTTYQNGVYTEKDVVVKNILTTHELNESDVYNKIKCAVTRKGEQTHHEFTARMLINSFKEGIQNKKVSFTFFN